MALEVHEAQDTLAKKNRAIEEYDRAFQGVATVLTGLFVLADQDELANKVRPSACRVPTVEKRSTSAVARSLEWTASRSTMSLTDYPGEGQSGDPGARGRVCVGDLVTLFSSTGLP